MGFIRAGILDCSLRNRIKDAKETKETDIETTIDETVKEEHVSTPIEFNMPVEKGNDYFSQIIPTDCGMPAKFYIPFEASENDLWLIWETLGIIMKRKFNINLKDNE